MAQLVNLDEFEALNAALEAPIAVAREMAERLAVVPPDATPEQDALQREGQALAFLLMATLKNTVLTDAAALVSVASVCGCVMAQSPEAHAELWRMFREQFKQSFDETMVQTAPVGMMQ